MSFKVLGSKAAAALDKELMSTGAYSIDQLMELAGLAVAQAVYKQYPPDRPAAKKVLVLVGPGNNGGDGLVAARHLKLWGKYEPVLYYPKKSASNTLYQNLHKQLIDLQVQELADVDQAKNAASTCDLILDALFGFSFHPPVRKPFDELISYLSTSKTAPIVSIDIPSGWDVDTGAPESAIDPAMLVSLTAPKPCALKFLDGRPDRTHYLGGRFINGAVAQKYGIEELLEKYRGSELITKL